MSVATNRPSANRVIIQNVRWETYARLLKDLEQRSSPRLTSDRGVLEIMGPLFGHEECNRTLASIVEIVLEELEVDFKNSGSTTFKLESLERGFEPDSSFIIQKRRSNPKQEAYRWEARPTAKPCHRGRYHQRFSQ